jgi:hypothetical protein
MRSGRAKMAEPPKSDGPERTHVQKRTSNKLENADLESIGDRARKEELNRATFYRPMIRSNDRLYRHRTKNIPDKKP